MLLDIIPEAIGIAVSPIPIIAILVILMGKRAKTNGLAFMAGWVIAVSILSIVILSVAQGGNVGKAHDPNKIAATVQLLLGLVLLFFAAKNWRQRPKVGQKAPMPKWLKTIDKLPTASAFGLAFMLGALNVKNIPLTTSAMLLVAEANASSSQTYASIAFFVAIASISICLPPLFYLCSPQTASRIFNKGKNWLTQHNSVILSVLFALLSIKIIFEALHKLS